MILYKQFEGNKIFSKVLEKDLKKIRIFDSKTIQV